MILIAVGLSFLFLMAGCTEKLEIGMKLEKNWKFKADSLNVGIIERWYGKHTSYQQWKDIKVSDFFDNYGLPNFQGVVWYHTTFMYHGDSTKMTIFFGAVDDEAEVWLNGIELGMHAGFAESFYFDVQHALRQGENTLVVRVKNIEGPGGIYKPVTLLHRNEVNLILRTPYADMPARKSADWVKDGVIYEVYLRSFSRDGSIKSLERRLGEIKELGVNTVWLMPIHPVGELNRKGKLGSPYSVEDYYAIDPEYGTIEDFQSLVKSTHDLGMHIIIDLVANHTSWDSKLIFEHSDWFTLDSTGSIVAPNSDWSDVADLDYNKYELRKYMIKMMKYWVKDIGIDGFRCDVAELVPTDFWERARKELDNIKPVMMLSEGTLPEHHVEAFDLTYAWNMYDVLPAMFRGEASAQTIDELLTREGYRFPKGSLRLRFNTNHDKNAWDIPATLRYSTQGAKMTAVLMFTIPGVPLIYNGEEVGNDKRLSLFEKVNIDWSRNADFKEFYKKLGSLRITHRSFAAGEYTLLRNSKDSRVYSFERAMSGEHVVVAFNFASTPVTVDVETPQVSDRTLIDYFSNQKSEIIQRRLRLTLPARGFAVLVAPPEDR
jgi:glycosidase